MKIIGIIPARGGSKGIPKKNLVKILDKSLLHYAINSAKRSHYIDKFYVSTDDEEIAKEGKNMGCKIIKRPIELATKEALAEEAFIHAFNQIKKFEEEEIEALVLLFCNGATLLSKYIEFTNLSSCCLEKINLDLIRTDSTLSIE